MVQVSAMKTISFRGVSGWLCRRFLIGAVTAAGMWAQVPKPTVTASPSQLPGSRNVQRHEMTAGDVEAFLDGIMPMQLQREDIAGAVVVIVKNGNVLFAKGYGYADVKAKVPVSPAETLFRPGSISKTFTWTAIMQLVEQGKINLDADVNSYLDFQVPHTFRRPVTVRNLMTHTPGFEEVIKDLMVDRPDQLMPLHAFVIAHRPNQIYPPGTIPAYSNYGADLAGYIVERVSGLPFEEYVQKNIFQPLGMLHATFVQPLPERLKSMMSQGYELASQDPKPFELVPPAPAPDGSLSITGADMAPFMIAHLQNGKYGDTRILQPQTAEMMHARQFSMDPAVNGMALGFYEESRNGLRIIGHGGDLNYFHSDMHLILRENLGFFVSYNSLGKAELDVRTALWDKFLDRYFPVGEIQAPIAQTADTDAIEGKYLSSRRAQTSILRSLWWILAESSVTKNADGTIAVDSLKDFSGQPKRWRSVGNMQFREIAGQQLLVFKPDPSGRLAMITEDPIEISQRVPWTQNKIVLQCALGFAALIFLGTLVFWPVGAFLRRHYRQSLAMTPLQLRLRLLVKFACAVEIVALIAFAATVAYGFSNLSFFSSAHDWWFRLVQLLFLIGFIAAIFSCYGAYRVWASTGKKTWAAAYTGGLLLASVIYIWFAVASRILQFSLKY
jgi:CubicO group peptidase (beta-lactamase class C family)